MLWRFGVAIIVYALVCSIGVPASAAERGGCRSIYLTDQIPYRWAVHCESGRF